jgi:DNA-binding NarL/FixJ family response regulator
MGDVQTTFGDRSEIFKSRTKISTLVVAKQGGYNYLQIRTALNSMGISHTTYAASHVNAMDRLRSKNFQLIVFEAHPIDMPTVDFVRQAVELDPNAILIAVSAQPRIDDVFTLLKLGARGFVIPPFTADSFEQIVIRAAEGPPFSQSVLDAPDRNTALVGVVLNNFYRLTVRMRQSRKFKTAAQEVEHYKYSFSESIELAKLFCEGGDEALLLQRIQEECAARSEIASSRLGRMRQKLAKQRQTTDGETEENSGPVSQRLGIK